MATGGVDDLLNLSVNRNPTANADHHNIAKHTNLLCRDIKHSFHDIHNDHLAPTRGHAADSHAKKELIRSTKTWVEWVSKSDVPFCIAENDSRRHAVTDALAFLLRTLDDVDVENLQHLRKRLNDQKTIQPSVGKRRSRLPPKIRSTDMVRALHDAEIFDTNEERQHLPSFYLSYSDRNKRAKRTYLKRQHGYSLMGISMKAVMNAHVPIKIADGRCIDAPEWVFTTLSLDAADLRRHLYTHLAMADRRKCYSPRCETDRGSSTSEKLQSQIKTMTSALLRRITSCPKSPSMRLSAMIALDSLHEVGLRDWGYDYFLNELLDTKAQLPIEFHAEILSECQAYENPLRLLRALSKLMKKALEAHSLDDGTSLRRGVLKVLVRRQNLLATFNQDSVRSSSLLMKDVDDYNRLCDRMSVRFGSISNWILPTMNADEKESVISALQAAGILSLFCCEDIDNEDNTPTSQSPQTVDEYPISSSLRSAYERMGSFDVFNRLLSHPKSYDQIIQISAPSLTSTEVNAESPLSSATDDMLVAIFAFLGFRSLSRASTCCVSWKRASAYPTLWTTLYFRKYRNALWEEALLDSANCDERKFIQKNIVPERQRYAAWERHYDWKYIFSTKYTVDKRNKAKSCSIVGCLHVSRRSTQTHMKRHLSAARAQKKKCINYVELKEKVQNISSLVTDLRSTLQPQPSFQPKTQIRAPHDILRYMVFPYLDYRDLVKPICKLWTRLAGCNLLWKSLHARHFGTTSTQWSNVAPHDWKLHFRSTLSAKYNVQGITNQFGWPLHICPSCNEILHSKFECDFHLLKHEERYVLDEVKRLKRIQRDQSCLAGRKTQATRMKSK